MTLKRTPLRYPGGKQKVTPFIREILIENNIDGHYVEPYAGGAGVAISLLLSNNIKSIHLNDSDVRIYAFWHAVKHDNERFCSKISSASLTIDEWKKQKEILKNPMDHDLFDVGFSTFFLNRCNRSGVLKAGVIGGINQDGNYKMNARFSRNDLIRRIELIGVFSDKISLSNLDAEELIEVYIPTLDDNSLIYFDPPYFNKAKDLYLNSYVEEDHRRLSEKIQNEVNKPWILSYDNVPEIVRLYPTRKSFTYNLQYSAAKNYKGKEVFIFCDNIAIPNESALSYINDELKELSV
jgi:DNA adenine methylase